MCCGRDEWFAAVVAGRHLVEEHGSVVKPELFDANHFILMFSFQGLSVCLYVGSFCGLAV